MLSFSLDFKKLIESLIEKVAGTQERPTALRLLPGEIKKTWETQADLPEFVKKTTKALQPESVDKRAQKIIAQGVPQEMAYQKAREEHKQEEMKSVFHWGIYFLVLYSD